jgi:hypothetical protein
MLQHQTPKHNNRSQSIRHQSLVFTAKAAPANVFADERLERGALFNRLSGEPPPLVERSGLLPPSRGRASARGPPGWGWVDFDLIE